MAAGGNNKLPDQDNTADLVADYLNGKPILNQVLSAMASGDTDAMDSTLSSNGYNVTEQGAEKLLQTAAPGPDFDVRMVAGLYSFETPKDMSAKRMRIDPLNGRLYIDELWVHNLTDEAGHVNFDYSGNSFSLVFTVTYHDSGVPNPYEFSSTPNAKIQASGKQILPKPDDPPAEDWTSKPGWMQAGTIITIFGGGGPLLISLLKKLRSMVGNSDKTTIDKTEAGKITADLEKLSKQYKEIVDKAAEVAQALNEIDISDQGFKLSEVRGDLEMAIEVLVNKKMASAADPLGVNMDTLKDQAADAVKTKIYELYEEVHGTDILKRFDKFNDILDADGKERVVENIINKRLNTFNIYKQPTGVSWFDAVVNKVVSKAQSMAVKNNIAVSEAAIQSFVDKARARQAEKNNLSTQAEKLRNDPSEAAAMTPAERQAELDRLQREIASLDHQVREANDAEDQKKTEEVVMKLKKQELDEQAEHETKRATESVDEMNTRHE